MKKPVTVPVEGEEDNSYKEEKDDARMDYVEQCTQDQVWDFICAYLRLLAGC